MLGERDLLGTAAGRDSFAILLLQDLASIPLVALVPFIAGHPTHEAAPWLSILKAAGGVAVILVGGRWVLRPVFRLVAAAKTPEIFTATALLLVAGASAIADLVGLPMSLGAFAAGVLLSESAYRHELQADVEPFEGLLLGFFFISVGMAANVRLAIDQPILIIVGVLLMMSVKIGVLYALARLRKMDRAGAVRLAFALPQGSEFAFVLFAAAVAVGALAPGQAARATLIIALSMLLSPLLFAFAERFLVPRLTVSAPAPVYDKIEPQHAPVIIAGVGRMGQIVGRILRMQGIAFTALEPDSEQVEQLRRYGTKVFFGDPSRPEVLRAAGAAEAKLLVLATDDVEESLSILDTVKREFPNLKVVARARDRYHFHQIMARGYDKIVRETYHSSLVLAEEALKALGHPAERARRDVKLFRDHDERLLLEQGAFFTDEQQMIQSSHNAAEELAGLLEADRRQSRPAGGRGDRKSRRIDFAVDRGGSVVFRPHSRQTRRHIQDKHLN